jgi:CubicO group peptidase (beta-lactamase class C family)
MGFWMAIRMPNDTATTAFGFSDGVAKVPAAVEDVVPAGSLAKSFTAAAIMRLVDAGLVNLDDPVTDHVDPFLLRTANTTLQALYGPLIAKTSMRTLLSMRAGLSGYNGAVVRPATETEPLHDIGPIEYLLNSSITPRKMHWRCNASVCDPPTYNSMGFLLMGLALAHHANASSWEELDQKAAALPASLQEQYNGTIFFKHGPCSSYPQVAHYYDYQPTPNRTFVDLHNDSCLNGFGFGNVGNTALDAASFFFDLVGRTPRVVSAQSVIEMQQWGEVLAGHKVRVTVY